MNTDRNIEKKTHTIIAPIPRLTIPEASYKQTFLFPPYITISQMNPQLRTCLLEASLKDNQRRDDEKEKIREIILQSDIVFFVELDLHTFEKQDFFLQITFPPIAYIILKRICDLMRLFADIPGITDEIYWFHNTDKTDTINQNTLSSKLCLDVNPLREHIYLENQNDNIDIQFVLALFSLEKFWNKLKSFSQVESLLGFLTDKETVSKLITRGNDEAKCKTEHFVLDVYDERRSVSPHEEDDSTVSLNLSKQQIRWFAMGMGAAYWDELINFEEIQNRKPQKQRLFRAFQIFTNCFRLKNPLRFASFITCLEALFSTDSSELSYQLSSRIAWLLKPDDFIGRREIFDQVKKLYGFRSKIVHGDVYKYEEMAENDEKALSIVRQCFWKILSDDEIYKLFCEDTKKQCDEFLKHLFLGRPSEIPDK
ncbi:MAG: hypothetical protein WC975_01950 [Phycisphaerae bacterium]